MTKRIQFSDRKTVVDELRQFWKTGDVTTKDDRIRIDFRSAHIEVSQDGHVSTGMPLHELEQEGAVDLVVDHDH